MWWACLLFPELPLDAVRADAVGRDCAAALSDGPARSPRIVTANAAARGMGVRPGQSVAAARALGTDLHIWTRDRRAEQRLLETLANWAYRYSGQVSVVAPRALLVEIGASLKLFDGWPALERHLRDDLDAWGLSCRLAAAPVASGARVLAAHADGLAVTTPQQLRHALDDVPLHRCGLMADAARCLHGMGFTRLGEVFDLPRAELARRIGPAAIEHLDRMRGVIPEALAAYCPPSRYTRRIEFDQHVEHVQSLLFPLQRLLRELAMFLVTRDAGVQGFELILEHDRQAKTRVPVGLLAPRRDAASLLEFARGRLERLELVAAVSAMTLVAEDLPTLRPLHQDLFETSHNQSMEWPALVERLRARLGEATVRELIEVPDHRPDRAWQSAALSAAREPSPAAYRASRKNHGNPDTPPTRSVQGARPFWFLSRAIPLRPAPARILAGPERIETGWWDDHDQRRDYYVVQTRHGQRAWAFLAAGAQDGWMLQGWFA